MRKDREDEFYLPELPPVRAGEYLLSFLWEIGPTMAAGAGQGPITNEEIVSWQTLIGITLAPWESRAIRSLSRDYMVESHKAERRDCPAPWRPDDQEPDVASVAKQMKSSIASLAKL